MKRRNDRHHRLTVAAAGAAMALLLAACSADDGRTNIPAQADQSADRGELRQEAADRDESVIPQLQPNAAAVEPDVAGSAASDDEAKVADNGWHADPPTLLGVKIGERELRARDTLGKPSDEYGIADPEPLTIIEYDGYSAGIGASDGRIRFIEVHSPNVPTGLGSLTVGGTADEAREALGEPDSASSVVLRYVKDGLTLKLDLDPKTKTIAVIRLFDESLD